MDVCATNSNRTASPSIDDANQSAIKTNVITQSESNCIHFINNKMNTKTFKDSKTANLLRLPKTKNGVNDCEAPSTSKGQKHQDMSVAEILLLLCLFDEKNKKKTKIISDLLAVQLN